MLISPALQPDKSRAFLLAGLSVLLLAEVLLLSLSLDARSLLQYPSSGWLKGLAYSGDLAKCLVVFVTVVGLAMGRRMQPYGRELLNLSRRHQLSLIALHGAAYLLFFRASYALFGTTSSAPGIAAAVWLLLALATACTWLIALAPLNFWRNFLWHERASLGLALAVATVVWLLALSTTELWGPLSDATFQVSAFILNMLSDSAILVAEDKILGAGDFMVNIAAACSGYEGIGLMLAFTATYLYVYRKDFHFPSALLLFPLGAVCIWLLNSVRIVILVLIGSHWSADVAVGGFHSQAGWLMFIACALGVLTLAHSSRLFAAQSHGHQTASSSSYADGAGEAALPISTASAASDQQQGDNSQLATATLIPMVALLAATLLTLAFTAEFVWLYPLRVLATGLAIAYCWRHLQLGRWKLRIEPLLAGAVVAALWFWTVPVDLEANALHSAALGQAPAVVAGFWLLCRFLGAVITVPIAEELAFRGYMLCRASSAQVRTRGRVPASLTGIAVSSLAFGLLHGAWLAGTLAGLVYAIVRLRSDRLTDAIVAHAFTNGLLWVWVMFTGNWYLL